MTEEPAQTPRLNPFIFPSETDFRFVLLVLMTIGGCLFCFERLPWLRLGVRPEFGQRLGQLEQCFGVTSANWFDELGPLNDCIRDSFGLLAVSNLRSQLVGLGWVLLFVGVVYSLLPTVMVTREKLVPLDQQPQSNPLCEAYGDLCKEISIARPPQLMLKATSRGVGPRIFGCWGRYRIVVPGGLALRAQDDPTTFRAVMLHELGHLKNRDVDKTYLAFAMGLAFLVIGWLPMVGVSVWSVFTQGDLASLWQTLWRGILLLWVMYLTLASVVRSREYYADLQASRWDPENDRLTQLLTESLGARANSWQTRLLRLTQRVPPFRRQNWDYALQFHPDPRYRAQILTNPDDLFHFDFWVALGTGLSVTLISQTILGNLETMRRFSPLANPETGFLIVGLIFGPAIAGICALGIWRMTFAQLLHPELPRRVGPVGLGLGLGLVMGQYLNGVSFTIEDIHALVRILIFNGLWIGLLTLCLVCFAHWIQHCAKFWLPVTLHQRAMRWVYRLSMVVSSLVLSFGLGWLLMVRDLGEIIALFGEVGIGMAAFGGLYIGYLALHPVTLGICTLLWLFPLSAWFVSVFWQRRSATQPIPDWAFLDKLGEPMVKAVVAHGKPIFHSLKRGILGGVAYVAMLLLLRILLRRLVPEVTRESDGFALFLYYGVNLGIAVLVQWIVALFTPRHPSYTNGFGVIHGLFSVAVSGLIMTGGILWLNVAFGGSLNTQFVRDTLTYTLNLGTMVALPTLLLSVGLWGRE
ncbi:MAG: M48 family metalloprotease [Cyanobacteria bacterium P01_D01_bin.44]